MRRRMPVLHPFLYGLLPVLTLLTGNIQAVRPAVAIRPAVICSLLAGAMMALLRIRVREERRAALICSAGLLVFFSYGHVYRSLPGAVPGEPDGLRHALLLLGFGIALGAWAWLLARRPTIIPAASTFFTVTGLALLAMSVLGIANYEAQRTRPWLPAPAASAQHPPARGDWMPDVYYIILDGYGRQDILERLYGVDNSAFLDGLRDLGFRVADQARSNYAQTSLSLASSLNMAYLDSIAQQMGEGTRDQGPIERLIRLNEVSRQFRELGYLEVAFSTGYRRTELDNASLFLRVPQRASTGFEGLLVDTSTILAIEDGTRLLGWPFPWPGYHAHRDQIRFTLNSLEEVASMPGPKFVFAHIIAPHPPFVFDRVGNPVTPSLPFRLQEGSEFLGTREEYIRGYSDQLTFIGGEILRVVGEILDRSSDAPIIILQADHGPGSRTNWRVPEESDFEERLSILNAYYLPGGGEAPVYASISPVNTFRVVFNRYFGADYELLPDESYFSSPTTPYQFLRAP